MDSPIPIRKQDSTPEPATAKSSKVDALPTGAAGAKGEAPQHNDDAPMLEANEPKRGGRRTRPPKRGNKARRILLAILALGGAFGAYEGYTWWTHGRFYETTDDAYVSADITTIMSKVSGHVAAIEVSDNQTVRAGDVLVRLDDGDYRLAVRSAENAVASAKAAVVRIEKQIEAGKANVTQAEASVDSAAASYEKATTDHTRQKRLVETRTASQSTLDTAEAALKQSRANLASARAAVVLANANIDVLRAQREEALQAVASSQTALAKAKRDLSFTVIRAPVDGVVGNRAVDIGTLLQPGSRVAAMVPLSKVYVEANFKETQLEGIEPGAVVDLEVDALPGEPVHGTVESISPATGSVFSLLPPENATGNFTKVVQRVPVRIAVSPEEAARGHLRAGMSVEASVDTRTGNAPGATTAAALH
ncbi:HlyD family secretion protein [Breoghania sp.]|uniref:HlyD family secretion protein n=1 Tax=Breoghania sp. TaxID=2065378 RepID=UPI0029CA0AF5|nr:HlyD family secretion protein [Breoghania sp.]